MPFLNQLGFNGKFPKFFGCFRGSFMFHSLMVLFGFFAPKLGVFTNMIHHPLGGFAWADVGSALEFFGMRRFKTIIYTQILKSESAEKFPAFPPTEVVVFQGLSLYSFRECSC